METGEKKYGIPNIERLSRHCFYIGLCLAALALLAVAFLAATGSDLREMVPPCSFHSMTGLYCPGCGGTRAVYALLHGRILESLCYHPIVLYFAVGFMLYMLSYLLDITTKGRVRGLYFCPYYWYVAVGILLGQCVVKNVLLFQGKDLLL